MKIDVKLVKYLENGEATVELNTGKVVDIFYDPNNDDSESEIDTLFVDDVTGTVGEWLDMDSSDIPPEAMKHLREAYNICCKEFEK